MFKRNIILKVASLFFGRHSLFSLMFELTVSKNSRFGIGVHQKELECFDKQMASSSCEFINCIFPYK